MTLRRCADGRVALAGSGASGFGIVAEAADCHAGLGRVRADVVGLSAVKSVTSRCVTPA